MGHDLRKRNMLSCVKLQKYYRLYFKIPYVGSLWYTPDYCCASCARTLYGWAGANEARIKERKEYRRKFEFKVPMIWKEPPKHDPGVCFFCKTIRVGVHSQSRSNIQYDFNEFTVPPLPRHDTEKVPKCYKENAREEGRDVSEDSDADDHEVDEEVDRGINDAEADDNIQMEIDDNAHIFDEIYEYGEIFSSPEELPSTSGEESRHTTRSSVGTITSVAESFVTDTYPPSKVEKMRHFLSSADINDMGKNAE